MTRPATLLTVVLAVASGAGVLAVAQVSPEDHAKHHPGAGAPPGKAAGGQPAAGGMGMEGMGGMMDMMHGRPPAREPFPEMMNSPKLDAAARARLRAAGDERVREGTAIIADGLDRLAAAAEVEDHAGMQAALARIREGTARMESGITARRVAAGEADPPAAATDWLKREMNLTPPPASPTARGGPFGLSWFHFVVMVALIAFAAVMVGMYYRKMHRAADLLQALTGTTASAPTVAVAPASAPSPPPTPAAEPSPGPAVPTAGRWSGRLRVARVFQETPGVKTFRLMNPLGGVLPFTYLPGQFLTLTVLTDGKPVKRSYTIASSPTQHDYVEVTVKHETGGVVSGYLHDQVKEGDLLDCSGPVGSFVFTGRECKCILLIGGGVGITPLMSVIRYLTDRAWPGDVYLLYGVHAPQDIIFREEIEYLARRHPNFRVVIAVSHPEGTDWAGAKGRITKELIAQSVPDLASRYVHLCGPVTLMEAVKKELAELGVPADRVKTEAFGPALGRPEPVVAPSQGPPAGTVVALPTVTFARSHKAAPLPPEKTVLDVADQVGVPIDNSCRVGTCGTCRVKLLSGAVTMAVEDGLEPGDKEKNIILACQAKAAADVSVEA
jgi:ferredoxin-NADP reductase